jgi:serine/threonine-protein kinase
MATVYRAVHTTLQHQVAIKVVAPQIRDLPGVLARFLREARAATRLRGEHVVRVYDVGTTPNGSPYLVMELLEGKDLGRILDETGRLPVDDAIDYVLQTCEALAEVHGIGIVHRDLKPPNLFVTRGPDGLACVKLIDFGISRVDSPLLPSDTFSLTGPDVAMGSPRYMPPEQMEAAGSVDARSDIWGLGAILYEMLVGKSPFDGESLWDIYAAAMTPPPPPSSVRSDVPAELDAVVLRCLRADARERFADVADLAAELAPFAGDAGVARAEAALRVLDAARGLAPGAGEGTLSCHVSKTHASRIRRRASAAPRWRRRGVAGGAAIALVAIALAGRPVAQRLGADPPAAEKPAAPATQAAAADGEREVGAAVTLDSITLVGSAEPRHDADADAGAAAALPKASPPPRAASPASHPAPPPAAARAPENDRTPPSTLHVTYSPAPTPEVTPPPAESSGQDNRALFEERK